MIEVGEYIRTIDGYIRKVTSVNKKGTYEALCYGAYSVDMKYKNSVGISAKKIKAHSKNIIDLIEVGDIVNGCEVMNIYKPKDIWEPIEVEINSKCTRCFLEGEIKTILTHEQYEQNCYKVGDIE